MLIASTANTNATECVGGLESIVLLLVGLDVMLMLIGKQKCACLVVVVVLAIFGGSMTDDCFHQLITKDKWLSSVVL